MAKTPGLNLPYGIDPVNPVPVDSKYGPYADLTEAKTSIVQALRYDGLTVNIIGSGEYWWTSDLSDTGLLPKNTGGGGYSTIEDEGVPVTQRSIVNYVGAGVTVTDDGVSKTTVTIPGGGGGSGAEFPIAAQVYLVGTVGDQTRMGGTASRVYITFQEAYDAANALQVSLGGTNYVVINIETCTSAQVGDLALTATYNQYVILKGKSRSISKVGNITTSAGNIYIYYPNDVTIGNITSSVGIIGVTLGHNCQIGAMSTTSTSATSSTNDLYFISMSYSSVTSMTSTNTVGNASTIQVSTNFNCSIGVISSVSTNTNNAGCINNILTNRSCTFSNITLTSSTSTAGVGSRLALSNNIGSTFAAVSSTSTNGRVGDMTMTGNRASSLSSLTLSANSTTTDVRIGQVTLTDCRNFNLGVVTMSTRRDSANDVTANRGALTFMTGLVIDHTNEDIIMSSLDISLGVDNVSSNSYINTVELNNCSFVNSSLTSRLCRGSVNPIGGYIKELSVYNTTFTQNTYIGGYTFTAYNNLKLNIRNLTVGTKVVSGANINFKIQNNNCRYSISEISGVNFKSANRLITFVYEIVGGIASIATLPYTFDNVNAYPNATITISDDASVNAYCRLSNLDLNQLNLSFPNATSAGLDIFNSFIDTIVGSSVIGTMFFNNVVILSINDFSLSALSLSNTSIQSYTNLAASVTIECYNSLIGISSAAPTTYTGTVNNSTLNATIGDNIAGVTNNFSTITLI